MSDANAQEPTMEEILASIRRIISEDDAPPAAGDQTPPAAVEPAPVHAAEPAPPEPEPEPEDDVLELTDPLDAAVPEPEPEPETHSSLGDLDFATAAPPPPAPAFSSSDEGLVGSLAASAAASSFGQLSRSIGMPADGRTLEDVVMILLRPLLKDWLDRHLPAIVESKVQAEVERISRGRGF